MDNAVLRRTIYSLLIAVTAGITTARIVGAELVYEPSIASRGWPKDRPEKMPTYSSNDRSRWATMRALVENGTFVIGKRTKDEATEKGYRDEGIVFQDGYKTIDMVKKPETDEFFSSKPPLFTCLAAGEYWLLNKSLGLTLRNPDHRWPIICTILVTFNVLPLIVLLLLLSRLLEEYGTTDWGRLFVFASACFGTFLTTFAVTLNNHTPAACCAMFAVYPLLRGRSSSSLTPFTPKELVLSGFFASLAACFDLPSAALGGAIALVVALRSWRGLLWFVPAALIPAGAFLATNYAAVDMIEPVYSKVGTSWYEYQDSHWAKAKVNPNQKGIDFAREPKSVYAFHMLFGHHGVFSLTPIWLLALAGMIAQARGPTVTARAFGILMLLITAVVVGFYVVSTNNYEGWTSGPRWQFWLTPLFLIAMIPIADTLGQSCKGRMLAYLLLAIAVFSAAFPVWNPWRHPWIYVLCEYMDWVNYLK